MKLQVQYNRVTIISTFFILLIAAASYYFLLRYVLISQLDESLKVEEAELHDYIKKHDSLPAPTVYKDQRISFEKTTIPAKRGFKSLSIFYPTENSTELSRQLLFPVALHQQNYRVSVTKSEESTQELVWIILFSTIGLLILLTAILFFTNRFLLKKLWQPFRTTLSTIKEFNLSAPAEISMQPGNIDEFEELNESIRLMTKKVTKDYQSLKDFTDHASHEMQTPLAIINSQLDLLIQEPELSEKTMGQVQGIYKSVEKLSRLCNALLLLARIENKQFTVTQLIPLHELVNEKASELEEWITAAQLTIHLQLDPLAVKMNRELAGMVVSNLLRNAIRHSKATGNITVQTNHQSLFVANSGKAALNKDKIFDRFYKSDHSEGSGLGLAIVRQICDQYQFALTYDFINEEHVFCIYFDPANK